MSGDNVARVNIGGKVRELVFGTRAICFIEESTGRSFAEAAGKGGIGFLVVSVAAGLSHLPEMRKRFRRADGEYDLSLVEEWFDLMPKADAPDPNVTDAPDTLRSLGAKVASAMRGGMPGVRTTDGPIVGEAVAAAPPRAP